MKNKTTFKKTLQNVSPKEILGQLKSGSFWQGHIVRFVIIGVINTLHFWLWYNLFLFLKISYPMAFTLGFVLSMIGSFFLNSYFTFRTRPTLQKFLRFPLTTLPNFIISQIGLAALVEQLGVQKNLAGLLASLIAIPITFLITKKVLQDQGTGQFDKEMAPHQVFARKVSNKIPWLGKIDLLALVGFLLFTYLCHRYIFQSGFLYGDDHTDSTVQMIYFLPYLLKKMFLGGELWSWNYGMGGDIYSEFSFYYTTSPVIWSLYPLVKALPKAWFSLENSLNLKLFISMYKQVLIMIFMYLLLRYEKRSRLSSFVAGIVYAGGIYYMWNANFFDFFTDAYLWVPLMILGYRIWQKKRNFWVLVLSAACCAINNYYFAFHTFLFFVFFVLVTTKIGHGRRHEKRELKNELKAYFRQVGSVAWQGFAAIALSMFAFLPAVYSFLKIDRFDTVNPVNLFYGKDFYENLPINLFFNNSTLGIPMLIILALFLNYRNTSRFTDRKMILLGLTFALYCTPYTGYILNGMNYHSERWFYLLLFVFAYALADILDEVKKPHHFTLPLILILAFGTLAMIYYRWDMIQKFDDLHLYLAVLILNFLAFILIALRNHFARIPWRKITDIVVVACIFGIMVANNWAYAGDQKLNMNTAKMEKEKMKSPELEQVMSKVVPKETEFYRTVFRNNNFENAPTYYNYYGISTFASMTDGNMHDWIKRILNIRHDITYLSSFNNLDDRTYLEGLLGVRYLIGEGDSYEPVPMYEKVFSNNKYSLYENKNTVGIDLWYEEELPEDSLYSMIQPDMDLNLLNYVVTKDSLGLPVGKAKASEEIPLTKENVNYDKVEYDGSSITFEKGGQVTFTIPNATDESQIYLHTYLRPTDGKEFDQNLNSKKIFKSYETNPYVYYTNDWTWAINGNEKELRWSAAPKEYEIKDYFLRRVDLKDFDNLIKARNKYNLENLKVEKNTVSGTVNNANKGVMVLNIPFNKGWRATDNGKPLTITRANGFLSAIQLEPGSHELKFTFRSRGLTTGWIISILTLLGLIAYSIYRKKHGIGIEQKDPDLIAPILPQETTERALAPTLYREKYRSGHTFLDCPAWCKKLFHKKEASSPIGNQASKTPSSTPIPQEESKNLKDSPDSYEYRPKAERQNSKENSPLPHQDDPS